MGTPDRPHKSTLEFALRPYAISAEELCHRHRGVLEMVQRLLGVVPNADRYLEIWPPGFVTYNLAVPILLDVPRADFGFGLAPEVRSIVAHVASRSHGCSYCAAHAAVVGSLVRGPRRDLEAIDRAATPADAEGLPAPQRAAIDYARAIARIPSEVGTAHHAALEAHFSPYACLSIQLVACALGFLNRTMDTLGIVIEEDVREAVERGLARSGYTTGRFYDPSTDAELEAIHHPRPSPIGLLRSMASAIAAQRRALAAIPRGLGAQSRAVRQAIGFAPAYLRAVQRTDVRRLLTHFIVERMSAAGGAIPSGTRWAMAHVAAVRARNPIFASHTAAAALHAGVDIDVLAGADEPPETSLGELELPLLLAHATSTAPCRIDQPLIDALMDRFAPAEIIELVTAIGITGALQRLTASGLGVPAHGAPEPDVQVRLGPYASDLAHQLPWVEDKPTR